MLRSVARLLVIGVVWTGGCSHQPSLIEAVGSSQSAFPHVVQTGGGDPHWVNVPLMGGRCGVGYVASGFSTHMWVTLPYCPTNGIVLRVGFDGTQTELSTPTLTPNVGGLTTGPNGNIWFTELSAGKLAEIAMPAGPITEFPLPHASEQPIAVTTGADHNVWFADLNPGIGGAGIVGKMTTTGTVTEYQFSQISYEAAIAAGPDGNVWVGGWGWNGSCDQGYVARVTPAGTINEFQIPTACETPTGIVNGPDGNLWVSGTSSNGEGEIVKVTPSGSMTEYPTISAGSIDRGSDKSLFFSGGDGLKIGEISVSGVIHLIKVPNNWFVEGSMARGPDGNEWFMGSASPFTQRSLLVYVRRLMNVTPSPLHFTGAGQSQTIVVTEKWYSGSWTAQSSNSGVATVAAGSKNNEFVVTSTGSGSCTVTVSDANANNSFLVPVTVNYMIDRPAYASGSSGSSETAALQSENAALKFLASK